MLCLRGGGCPRLICCCLPTRLGATSTKEGPRASNIRTASNRIRIGVRSITCRTRLHIGSVLGVELDRWWVGSTHVAVFGHFAHACVQQGCARASAHQRRHHLPESVDASSLLTLSAFSALLKRRHAHSSSTLALVSHLGLWMIASGSFPMWLRLKDLPPTCCEWTFACESGVEHVSLWMTE